jgi:hypothetical protein
MQKSLPARIPIYIENVSVFTIASVNASDWDKLFARRNWIVKSAHLGLGRSRRQRELCGWRMDRAGFGAAQEEPFESETSRADR